MSIHGESKGQETHDECVPIKGVVLTFLLVCSAILIIERIAV